ncbi:site-specific integrase [Micromonospora sp. NPDC047753]|uniref:site-specific integrase n=1 Tax=Micromonospora sp. NPDC047753 TaxID=3154817 RepID=UPI0033CBDD2A
MVSTACRRFSSRSTTRRAYLRDLGHYLAWLAALDRDPLQVTRPDVDAYVALLRRQTPAPSAASLNRRLAALSSWYRYLIDADIATRTRCSRSSGRRSTGTTPPPSG